MRANRAKNLRPGSEVAEVYCPGGTWGKGSRAGIVTFTAMAALPRLD